MSGGLLDLLERLVDAGVDFVLVGGYDQVVRVSAPIDVEGRRLRVLTIDALIVAKETMNRARDREAVRQLEVVRRLREEGGLTDGCGQS
ncbi:MAG: hypothetical protein RBS72_04290 [Sedimentisphaerales bacterium]|nr:hypothetical protein [Sedimentisphaerales bacterium]HNY77576.1 hypothetical protein [Sedimentisphaerales bacterium]HOC61909.1 hypothetical protein [Sedimentisphaerales bacterium]HOH63751.1 hypothetical protein [Sedimentisphaerales bacterium]HPY48360.1 hypothetical protein [Sedimentisphaerales bacterium]